MLNPTLTMSQFESTDAYYAAVVLQLQTQLAAAQDQVTFLQNLLDSHAVATAAAQAEIKVLMEQKPACYMGTYNSADIRDMYTKVMRNVEDFQAEKYMPDRIDPLYLNKVTKSDDTALRELLARMFEDEADSGIYPPAYAKHMQVKAKAIREGAPL